MPRTSVAMQVQNLIDLVAYAQNLGFSITAQDEQLVFFPEDVPWEHYLILSTDLATEGLEFLSFILVHQRKPEYSTSGSGNFWLNKAVSLEWIKDYLRSQSEAALQESKKYRERAELNKKIIEAKGPTNSSIPNNDYEPDRIQPYPSLTGSPPIQHDEDYSAGPNDDDWDQDDWEGYMSGPELEDGEYK